MKATKEISVLISGASIAGLSSAYWLVKYGFKVTIVERARHIRPGGQALDVRGPALDVARRMGILDSIRAGSTKLQGMSVIDAASGNEIYRNTDRTITAGRFDSPDIEILRDDLCQILLQAVGDQADFIFNDSILSLDKNKTGVDVTFAHAEPRHFDLVIGADGTHSNVRRLVFGPEKNYSRYLGYYVAIFTMPNIFGLDHWEMFVQDKGRLAAAIIVKEKEGEARTYLGYGSAAPIEYDYYDISSQKRIITEGNAGIGWKMPQILEAMQESSNFYFDAVHQIIMDSWSKGRIGLVGDAGYSASLTLGQGTTIAMVGAYVLAGELATHKDNLQQGLESYEHELRAYVEANQKLAYDSTMQSEQEVEHSPNEDAVAEQMDLPDFGLSVVPFEPKNYT